MKLYVEQKQTQSLSPQEIQSIKILQMGRQELTSYLQDLVQENPILEMTDTDHRLTAMYSPQRFETPREDIFERRDLWNVKAAGDTEQRDLLSIISDPRANFENDLRHHILWQLPKLEEPLYKAVCFLIDNLDSRGWINTDLQHLSYISGFSVFVLEKAITEIQNLEPAGIGAQNLKECLLLQLKRIGGDISLAAIIVSKYLQHLAHRQYYIIARELHIKEEKVRQACHLIRSLNPKPASGFGDDNIPKYIIPDVIITKTDHLSEPEVLINYSFPKPSINDYYLELMHETLDPEVKNYINLNYREARWIVSALEQRSRTLKGCAKAILIIQKDFFSSYNGYLKPLTMNKVANMMGVNVSTVSRAVNGKYLECYRGVYPISFFFSGGLACDSPEIKEDTVSVNYLKNLLLEFTMSEDKSKPLSDQKLCELFTQKGYKIARRTVAKYRDEMNIPPKIGRRK